MKKRDYVLVAVILCTAFVFWIVPKFFSAHTDSILRISIDGELYGEYPLDTDAEIAIGTTNICKIQDQSVKMTEADCPDHLCLKQKSIDASGGTIVCLPNRIVLEIADGEQTEPDSIAR